MKGKRMWEIDEGLCDESFLEQVRFAWRTDCRISNFDRILRIAERCKSQLRTEEECAWLRRRIDQLTKTDFAEAVETHPRCDICPHITHRLKPKAEEEYNPLEDYFYGMKKILQRKGILSEDVEIPLKPTELASMTFMEAVGAMKTGRQVRRLSWLKGEIMHGNNRKQLFKKCSGYCVITWMDVEATDWEIVK